MILFEKIFKLYTTFQNEPYFSELRIYLLYSIFLSKFNISIAKSSCPIQNLKFLVIRLVFWKFFGKLYICKLYNFSYFISIFFSQNQSYLIIIVKMIFTLHCSSINTRWHFDNEENNKWRHISFFEKHFKKIYALLQFWRFFDSIG